MENGVADKKPIVIIALITAVSLLGNEMLFIVMPIYWKFFGLTSLWQIGALLSANRIIRLPINSLVGWCYQNINKRTGLLIAVVIAVISTYSYGVLKGFWLLLAARILWGIAWSFLRLGGYLTVIACSDRKTRGHFMGLYNGLWGLGALFGMLIGGLFTEIVGIQTITTVFAILGVCSIPFVIRYVPNTISGSEMNKQGQQEQHSTIGVNRKKLVAVLLNGLLVAFVVYGIFSSTVSKVVEYQFGDNITFLTYTISVVAVAGVLQSIRMGMDPFLAPFFGKLSDQRFGRIPLLRFALLVGIICLLIIPLKIPFIVFVLVIFIFQIVSTLLITTSDSLAVDLSSDFSSVKTMTYYTLVLDLGSALGPLISYLVINFIGLRWLYWATGILLICLLVFWSREYRQQRVNDNTFYSAS
ncbi:MFS transporter [Sporosarcina sp. YIM B06819]|uniref:MFS transporter n=1 Tax=Sporosarcina sp. YIM B06819 TaxID=3081769 RepID=UPI00298D443E|nr:MFS transporter [Sporosarcina sp. YIM B06819]